MYNKKGVNIATPFILYIARLCIFKHILKYLAIGFHSEFGCNDVTVIIVHVLIDTVVYEPIIYPAIVTEVGIVGFFGYSANNVIEGVELTVLNCCYFGSFKNFLNPVLYIGNHSTTKHFVPATNCSPNLSCFGNKELQHFIQGNKRVLNSFGVLANNHEVELFHFLNRNSQAIAAYEAKVTENDFVLGLAIVGVHDSQLGENRVIRAIHGIGIAGIFNDVVHVEPNVVDVGINRPVLNSVQIENSLNFGKNFGIGYEFVTG